MGTLYELTFDYIISKENVNFSFAIPKSLHRDINISMKKCNDFYFERVCNDFDLFCELLTSNCLSDLYLIKYLRKNPPVVFKLVETYMQINNACPEVGLLLGNILKLCGFLSESENVLNFAFKLCENKTVSLQLLNILKELLHSQTLQYKTTETDKTFEILRTKILEMQNSDTNLASVFNSCASFELFRRRVSEARIWIEKASRGLDDMSIGRESIDIYIVCARIARIESSFSLVNVYLTKAVEHFKILRQSRDSLLEFYHAKLSRECLLCLSAFKHAFSKLPPSLYDDTRHLLDKLLSYFGDLYTNKYIYQQIFEVYQNILGYDHVLTTKVQQELYYFFW